MLAVTRSVHYIHIKRTFKTASLLYLFLCCFWEISKSVAPWVTVQSRFKVFFYCYGLVLIYNKDSRSSLIRRIQDFYNKSENQVFMILQQPGIPANHLRYHQEDRIHFYLSDLIGDNYWPFPIILDFYSKCEHHLVLLRCDWGSSPIDGNFYNPHGPSQQ